MRLVPVTHPAVYLMPRVFLLNPSPVVKDQSATNEITQPNDPGEIVVPVPMPLALHIPVENNLGGIPPPLGAMPSMWSPICDSFFSLVLNVWLSQSATLQFLCC